LARSSIQLLIAQRDALRDNRGLNLTDTEIRALATLGVLQLSSDAITDALLAQINPRERPDEVPPKTFSVRALVRRWQCDPALIRTMIAEGDLRSFKHGKLIRIPANAVAQVESRRDSLATKRPVAGMAPYA